MQKRTVTGLLALLLATVTLFGGCGNTPSSETGSKPASETEAVSETTETETEAATETEGASQTGAETKDPVEYGGLNYTMLIDSQEPSYMYEDYAENPCYKYWADMEWDPYGVGDAVKISIEFSAPTDGSQNDYLNTLIGTGEYPEIMSTSYTADKAPSLYEQGIALDLTEYVEKYMPNYMAWIEANPEYEAVVTNEVDGERKILQIYDLHDMDQPHWSGFVYRRDWVCRYGKNPKTGAAFTGGYNDEGVWEDDVVFPSGNTDPIYISDWEWMFDIFETAMAELNITDGYAFQMCSSGYWQTGELSFGGTSSWYYLDDESVCRFGPFTEGFRTYCEAMNSWYEKGWMNQNFDESTEVLFWKVDTPTVYSGKVGMWYGMQSSLGSMMITGDEAEGDPLKDCSVWGAPQPINDVYGDKSVQGQEPRVMFGNPMVGQSYVLTDKLVKNGKDIPTLLTAWDYLFSPEGGCLTQFGLSKEQFEETQDEFYKAHGLEDGAYWFEERDGKEILVHNPVAKVEDGVENAAACLRIFGLSRHKDVDEGYTPENQHAVDVWSLYNGTGNIISAVSSQLTPDQANISSGLTNNLRTYMSMEVPRFIHGELDPTDDGDWQAFIDGLNVYDPDQYCEFINEILGVE